jgi:hypothetical protein
MKPVLPLAAACALVVAVGSPAVLASAAPVASASKCTKKLATAGKCSLLVARYEDELTAFSVRVSLRGKVRTATIAVAENVKCTGGADPDGTFGDGQLRGTATVDAKGKFSGAFTGMTDNKVPLAGTLHGTISAKTATLAGIVTGSRNDPDEPPALDCSGTIKASAERS